MYFCFNKEPFAVNCDWLQFSVHLREPQPEIICPDGYRVELCQGNNIFEHRALVFDGRGAKFFTCLWKPFSKVLPSNLMTCQVANEYLYMGGMGIKWAFEILQEMVECTFNAIGRIDVCCDFQGSDERNEFLRHLNSGHYYAQHKSEGSSWWHEVGDHHKKQLHALTWGSPKSEIKVKIYHKSREQGLVPNPNAQAEKPWIVSEWRQAGMADVGNVWRLEFSLSGAGQLRWRGKPISLNDVCNNDWLLDVFVECYNKRFVTRINQGRRNGHHNDDTRVWLFTMPNRACGLKWADPKGNDYEVPASITLLRSLMRQVDNTAVMANRLMFEQYTATIMQVVRDYRLDGYFLRTYEMSVDDYVTMMSTNVGQGLMHTSPCPRKLMD